jgi:predicted RNase H-like HicB family nuclease
MNITFETEREIDGRWIAEVPELPGVMAYGETERQAIGHAEALALRALAENIAAQFEAHSSQPFEARKGSLLRVRTL